MMQVIFIDGEKEFIITEDDIYQTGDFLFVSYGRKDPATKLPLTFKSKRYIFGKEVDNRLRIFHEALKVSNINLTYLDFLLFFLEILSEKLEPLFHGLLANAFNFKYQF